MHHPPGRHFWKIKDSSTIVNCQFYIKIAIHQDDVYERLAPELEKLKENSGFLWHSSCYASYTSHENLNTVKKAWMRKHAAARKRKWRMIKIMLEGCLDERLQQLTGQSVYFVKILRTKNSCNAHCFHLRSLCCFPSASKQNEARAGVL